MSQLLGRMFFLTVLLLLVGTVASEESKESGELDCKKGMCTLGMTHLNEIIDRAYEFGYRKGYDKGYGKGYGKGYSEARKQARIIQVDPGQIPDFPTEYPLSPTRWVVPGLPEGG